jgi:hypothetical protein
MPASWGGGSVHRRNGPVRGNIADTDPISIINRNKVYYPQNPIVTNSEGLYVREPGNAVYDSVTDQWIVVYSVGYRPLTAVDIDASAALSDDGETWTTHPENPISTNRAEDPYIAKSISTGQVWRDSSGRAHMYAEEKSGFGNQRGIELYRSTANLLTGWTKYGRVVDRGTVGRWDENDRTSPIVFHDGTRLQMLFEGRSPTNQGEIGYAYSNDEGLTWTVAADPIIVRGTTGTWNDEGVVTDDIMKIGDRYVLLVHGQGTRVGNGSGFLNLGRYTTTVAPDSWDSSSFTEMAGNPFTTESNTAMFHGNDPGRLLVNITNETYWLADVSA